MITRDDVANWRVLAVDDHPDSLEVVVLTLESYGAEVHTARNGRACLDMLESFRPTFVLLDISMPVMDGWTALHQMRTDPELIAIPVIALTAHAMRGDKEEILRTGFDHYISKPFSPMSFLEDLLAVFNDDYALMERIQQRV
ncbi:MAG: response regulator [Chloroflexi bacterium]|nr:response regulator [Chloroflexota bacterium]